MHGSESSTGSSLQVGSTKSTHYRAQWLGMRGVCFIVTGQSLAGVPPHVIWEARPSLPLHLASSSWDQRASPGMVFPRQRQWYRRASKNTTYLEMKAGVYWHANMSTLLPVAKAGQAAKPKLHGQGHKPHPRWGALCSHNTGYE